ncbi:MAG: hypothetical protein IJT15_03610, partial [Rickettsiales bacterium]|nr:hypothetical protein [Rickettsiales bacterium]
AKTISGNCTERSYKYCTDSNATTCASTPTNTSYTYDCKFYGSTKKSCETKKVEDKYCTGEGTGCSNTANSNSVYFCQYIDNNKISCSTAQSIGYVYYSYRHDPSPKIGSKVYYSSSSCDVSGSYACNKFTCYKASILGGSIVSMADATQTCVFGNVYRVRA